MTTYTTIPDGDIDQDSPVTQPLMTALRDNVLAIQEGDASAPSILEGAIAGSPAGGIGTYALCSTGGIGLTIGQTIAGSSLDYAAANGSNSGVPSGTWRCMGFALDGSSNEATTTLFLRIS